MFFLKIISYIITKSYYIAGKVGWANFYTWLHRLIIVLVVKNIFYKQNRHFDKWECWVTLTVWKILYDLFFGFQEEDYEFLVSLLNILSKKNSIYEIKNWNFFLSFLDVVSQFPVFVCFVDNFEIFQTRMLFTLFCLISIKDSLTVDCFYFFIWSPYWCINNYYSFFLLWDFWTLPAGRCLWLELFLSSHFEKKVIVI